MERFNCEEGKARPGNMVQHTKEYSQEECAKRCCMRTDCVGYDWNKETTDCHLTNKVGKKLTDKKGTMTCERIPGNVHMFKSFTESFQVPSLR